MNCVVNNKNVSKCRIKKNRTPAKKNREIPKALLLNKITITNDPMRIVPPNKKVSINEDVPKLSIMTRPCEDSKPVLIATILKTG